MLIAIDEGKNFEKIDELLSDTYKYMTIPFQKNDDKAFIQLRKNVLEVTDAELKNAMSKNNSIEL